MECRSRRPSRVICAVLGLGAFLAPSVAVPAAELDGQRQLDGSTIEQFAQPLPLLDIAGGTIQTVADDGSPIMLRMAELRAAMLPPSFEPANGWPYRGTAVFGYRVSGDRLDPLTSVDTYVNPVIVATRHQPTTVRYINNLTTDVIAWRSWTDSSLHSAFHQAMDENMPDLGDRSHYQGPVLAVPHLHGGEVPALIDGGPEAWFASDVPGPDGRSDYKLQGPTYYSMKGAAKNEAIYRYPNTQPAAPLWFHDHLLGGTRLNATFAGLAGGYIVTDPDRKLPDGLLPVGLDTNGSGKLDAFNEAPIPLVIQDRMFDVNGELYFPTAGDNPEHPYWVPEFVGDAIVVNGKAWPYHEVSRQRYRFIAINGSNSRPYDMFLEDLSSGLKYPMWVIASDGGYLDAPVLIDPNAAEDELGSGTEKSLFMMPGERYEIIIDFAKVPAGSKLVMRNTAETVLGAPIEDRDGRLLEFRVTDTAPESGDKSYDPSSGIALRTNKASIVRLPGTAGGPAITKKTVDVTRQLTLNEVLGENGPLEALVNNSTFSGMVGEKKIPGSSYVKGPNLKDFKDVMGNYLTELPKEGETEIWEIVNLTMDAHPIHLHGVQFQLIDRQSFDLETYLQTYNASFPGGSYLPGAGPPNHYFKPNKRGAIGGNPDPVLTGEPRLPQSYETGWKDTVVAPMGEKTRFAVRIAPQDKALDADDLYFEYTPRAGNAVYVWHCHITDHEDNEMMRPMQFRSNANAHRTYMQGSDY